MTNVVDRGTLFLVVGPSGVGKDSILDGGRAHFAQSDHIQFAKRVITRPAGSGGEDHEAMSEGEFIGALENGAFLLSWASHGLRYGIPGRYGSVLREGSHVVANVSRSVIAEARERYQPLKVISINAPEDVLRQRLQNRGRETQEQIEKRLRQAGAYTVAGEDVSVLDNDGPLEAAIQRFTQILSG